MSSGHERRNYDDDGLRAAGVVDREVRGCRLNFGKVM